MILKLMYLKSLTETRMHPSSMQNPLDADSLDATPLDATPLDTTPLNADPLDADLLNADPTLDADLTLDADARSMQTPSLQIPPPGFRPSACRPPWPCDL